MVRSSRSGGKSSFAAGTNAGERLENAGNFSWQSRNLERPVANKPLV
jgi:hypothetical protein